MRPAPGPDLRALLEKAGQMLSQGRGAEALPIAEEAARLGRTSPEAAHLLGVCHLQAGNLAKGIEAFNRAVMLAPTNGMILNHLGVALCQSGRAGEGISALEKAVRLAPSSIEARNNLAHAYNEAGRFADALTLYEALVSAAPTLQPAWQGLASAYSKTGQPERALATLDAALGSFPDHAGFVSSRGRVLLDLNRTTEAEAEFRRALTLDPRQADAANNLGTLIEERGQLAEAKALFQQATDARPDHGDAWFNLGNSLEKTGDLLKARLAFRRAVALRPQSARTLAALITLRRKLCDWAGLEADQARLEAMIDAPEFVNRPDDAPSPFSLLSMTVDPARQLRVARTYSAAIAQKAARWSAAIGPFDGIRQPIEGRRLRVGYLSPDLREHPIGQLMAGVFEAHDRDRFEISAWSTGPDDASSYRSRIVDAVERFEDVSSLDPAEAARRMRAADLDIVIDLAGYTAHARSELLAARVAPVQVNYLGFPGSTGAAFMDWIIVDDIIAPTGSEALFSEKTYRLPGCYQANDDRQVIDADPVHRADFGLPEDAFVFCCFSMNYKIDAALVDAWSAILARVPGSVLWLFRTDAAAAENIADAFVRNGIARERVIFADRLAKPKHLARHRLADLFLDSFAYGAHTTASDALWAGLPVLTLKGDTFARRVGASIVTAAGLADMVTDSVTDYIDRAVALAGDRAALSAIRTRLVEGLPSCALFSTAAIAANLEAAYAGMVAKSLNR
jgi:predicted O-linked N-acetylglucosamine transferase (SPINDLY family)